MGNSAPGVSGGWFGFGEEQTLVVLRLHDYRSMGFPPGEELVGSVCLSPEPAEVARARRGVPAQLSVSAGTNLYIEFQASGSGLFLGDVRLPLEHIARRCGGSLYHMWLPLNNARAGVRGPSRHSESGLTLSGSEGYTLEHFDRALRNAARDPRLPMVCLSLSRADFPEGQLERYDLDSADSQQKARRFHGLLQSHAQHARLLQALYRQCRSEKQPHVPQGAARDALMDSWGLSQSIASAQMGGRHVNDSFVGELPVLAEGGMAGNTSAEEFANLRREIESTRSEANARINQAGDAIRTLKERLAGKQTEHERLRQETSRFRGDAETLERENELLARDLEKRSREGPSAGSQQDEVQRLKREVDRLKEQKEALVLILEDLYGNAKSESSKGASGQASRLGDAIGLGDMHAELATEGEQWTNMLPRPSELFASGVLDS